MTWAGVWIIARVENPIVIAAATETPRSEGAHAIRAHVGEGHGRGRISACAAHSIIFDEGIVTVI